MMNYNRLIFLFILAISFSTNNIYGQDNQEVVDGQNILNTVTTAVPFLTITPDSRAGSMGEVGAASTPDIHSLHWNSAKLAFLEPNFGAAVSYTPWLRKLIPDIAMSYLTLYNKIGQNGTFAGALRYFSLGEITFTDASGQDIKNENPNELSVDLAYAMKFSNNLSGGIAMRYIYSNLTGGLEVGSIETQAGQAFAIDLGTYYEADIDENNQWAMGLNISNIGTKISYTQDDEDFLPTNLKLGGRYSLNIDEYNRFSVMMDVNKLLVPTPALYDQTGDIIAGESDNVSVVQGIFQSFGDAPGGIQEEWRELMYSVGLEYWYNNQFAFRGGYFHEHATKGNRKYFNTGIGLKMSALTIDFSYLISATPGQQSPLESTIRFSLIFNMGSLSSIINDQNVQ